MITIKFIDFWNDFNPTTDPFFKMWFKWYNLKLTNTYNPDVIVFSGVYGKKQTYKLYNNSIKIFYTAENRIYDNEYFNDCDYSISHHKRNSNTHLRLLNGIRKFGLESLINFNKRVIPTNILKQKTKFCLFMYSNSVSYRNVFFKELSKYKHIDSCGPVLNNMPLLPKDNNIPYKIKQTIDFISKYKFIISFENELIDGYTTEKLLWGYLSRTVPIYKGSDSVYIDFNNDSLINANSRENSNVINEIIKLDTNDKLYINKLNYSIFNNKKIPKYWTKEYIKAWSDKIFNKL